MSFSSDLKDFTLKFEGNSEKVIRGTSFSLFRSVVLRTPVGNPDNWVAWDKRTGTYKPYEAVYNAPEGYVGGRLRGNWQASLSIPARGDIETTDKSGAKTVGKIKANIANFKLGQSIYLVNNLPYAIPIEKGNSSQAPAGMVRVTVTQFQREIDKQARKLK